MDKHVKSILVTLLAGIVLKSMIFSINIAEALVAISIVGFNAYLVYLDTKKAAEIPEDFNKRLTELETKSAFVGIRRGV